MPSFRATSGAWVGALEAQLLQPLRWVLLQLHELLVGQRVF